jgi:chaperonin cofactor prefoldin
MAKLAPVARLDNIIFLSRVGETLRWATNDVAKEELPEEIERLLRRLKRREMQEARKKSGSEL